MISRARPLPRLGLFVGGVFMAESTFYSVVPPLLPRIVAEVHMTTSEAGILVAAYPAGVMVAALPAIALVNRRGVRSTTVIGLGLLTLATLAFGWSSSAAVLDMARLVQGIGGAVAWAAALAWLICDAPAARRGTVIGGAVGAALFGMVVGPVIGAAATWIGRPFVFSGIAVVLVGMAAIVPASPHGQPSQRSPVRAVALLMRARRAAIGTFLIAVIGVINGTLASLAPLLIARRSGSAASIAAVFVAIYLFASFWNGALGRVADRLGKVIPLAAGFVVGAVLLSFLPSIGSLLALSVAAVVAGSVASGLWAPTAAMVADGADASPSNQAAAVAVTNAAWAAGGTIGAAAMSQIADTAGFALPFLLVSLLCAIAAAVCLASLRGSHAEVKAPSRESRR
jgi:predicted MFS family arabinose efflux permease